MAARRSPRRRLRTPPASSTLSEGNIGSTVERIQPRLIELGYMEGSATGTFDAATTEAVMAFQRVVGVAEDGVVTYSLYTQLISDDAPANGSAEAEAILAGGYTLLQEGDSGDAVTRLQTRLVELGYANGTPNGRYASATVSAVMLFQRAAGLEETGVATAALQALLYSDSAPAYTPTATQAVTGDRYYPYTLAMAELSEGSSGELVVYLQTRLAELGYFDGTVDGQYGSATAAAVRAVQANMGLEQTGVAGVTFQEHLYSEATPPSDTAMYDETQSFTTLQLGDSDPDGESMGPWKICNAALGTGLPGPRGCARRRGRRLQRSDASRRRRRATCHGYVNADGEPPLNSSLSCSRSTVVDPKIARRRREFDKVWKIRALHLTHGRARV